MGTRGRAGQQHTISGLPVDATFATCGYVGGRDLLPRTRTPGAPPLASEDSVHQDMSRHGRSGVGAPAAGPVSRTLNVHGVSGLGCSSMSNGKPNAALTLLRDQIQDLKRALRKASRELVAEQHVSQGLRNHVTHLKRQVHRLERNNEDGDTERMVLKDQIRRLELELCSTKKGSSTLAEIARKASEELEFRNITDEFCSRVDDKNLLSKIKFTSVTAKADAREERKQLAGIFATGGYDTERLRKFIKRDQAASEVSGACAGVSEQEPHCNTVQLPHFLSDEAPTAKPRLLGHIGTQEPSGLFGGSGTKLRSEKINNIFESEERGNSKMRGTTATDVVSAVVMTNLSTSSSSSSLSAAESHEHRASVSQQGEPSTTAVAQEAERAGAFTSGCNPGGCKDLSHTEARLPHFLCAAPRGASPHVLGHTGDQEPFGLLSGAMRLGSAKNELEPSALEGGTGTASNMGLGGAGAICDSLVVMTNNSPCGVEHLRHCVSEQQEPNTPSPPGECAPVVDSNFVHQEDPPSHAQPTLHFTLLEPGIARNITAPDVFPAVKNPASLGFHGGDALHLQNISAPVGARHRKTEDEIFENTRKIAKTPDFGCMASPLFAPDGRCSGVSGENGHSDQHDLCTDLPSGNHATRVSTSNSAVAPLVKADPTTKTATTPTTGIQHENEQHQQSSSSIGARTHWTARNNNSSSSCAGNYSSPTAALFTTPDAKEAAQSEEEQEVPPLAHMDGCGGQELFFSPLGGVGAWH
ncbi:unnamed protein product [Amoebophrya sp. A120]|nr:unnamed protein product [Amoebophrya sp. A120]|eukprot:GSA120T00000786001.1